MLTIKITNKYHSCYVQKHDHICDIFVAKSLVIHSLHQNQMNITKNEE